MSGGDGPAVRRSGYRERNSTADRALEILATFTEERLVVSGAEVAELLGTSRSTAYRYLQTLVSNRYLEEAPGGGFRLGARVLEIARLARRSYGLSDVALPVMNRLAGQVQESVLLTRRAGDVVVCLDRAESTAHPVRISYERGSTLPLNAGASALALLAWSDPDETRKVLGQARLRAFTPDTLTDVDALMERLSGIREAGYSVTRGEVDSDVLGIAAPIWGGDATVVAAISVAAVASRVPADRQDAMVRQVRASADEISGRLAVVDG